MKTHQSITASNKTGSPSVHFRNAIFADIMTVVFLLVGSTFSYAQSQLEWANQIGSVNDEYVHFLAIDSAGNVYLTGRFTGTVDFDPGPNEFTLTSEGSNDLYVLKLNSVGDFVWAKRIGGNTGEPISFCITVDISENVYVTGDFSGTVDFDPGPGVYNLTSPNRYQFVLKLDSAGDFVWAKEIGAFSYSVAVDASENVYLTGSFQNTVDFDPGPGVYNLTSYSGDNSFDTDIYILKLDSSGNFVWAKRIGGIADDWGAAITADEKENLFIEGIFGAKVDFDPGPDIYYLTGTGPYYYGFHLELDTAGNFIKAYMYVPQVIGRQVHLVCQDDAGNIYATGELSGTVDFDPGPGVYNLTSAGGFDVFATKKKKITPLPVSLVGFSAKQSGTSNQLNWQTAQEQNTHSFTIERSADGNRFFDIGSVTAAGNSVVPRSYSFTDVQPLAGTNFYRLKMIDSDGLFTYSKIVAVIRSGIPAHLQLFPNPVKNVLYVQASADSGSAIIKIVDATGKIILQQKESLSGRTSFSVDVQILPKGHYILIFQRNGEKEVQTFIKQ